MPEVLEWGEGDPVVLVHGDVFDAAATYSEQHPLAERHRLLLVNRRGFGNSPPLTDGPYTEDFEVDAGDIAALLDDVGPAHLVGHSYGGVVSLLAAARRPEQVRSLTVFEPPAFGLVADQPHVAAFVDDIKKLLAEDPAPDEFLRRFIRFVGGDPSRLPDPLPPPLVRAAGIQMKGRWPWEAEIPLDALRVASFPTLVVSGGHSALFDAVCDVLERELPARREVIPGAGHSVPRVGGPVNDALERFWATVE